MKLPAALTALGNGAFQRCRALTTLHIPAKVASIDPEAFFECTAMTAITVDPANPYYTAVDGVLYNKAMTELVYYPLPGPAPSSRCRTPSPASAATPSTGPPIWNGSTCPPA